MFCLFLCERTERGIVMVIDGRVERDLLNRFEVVDSEPRPLPLGRQAANQTTLYAVAEQVERQIERLAQALVALQQQAEAQAQWQAETFVGGAGKIPGAGGSQRTKARESSWLVPSRPWPRTASEHHRPDQRLAPAGGRRAATIRPRGQHAQRHSGRGAAHGQVAVATGRKSPPVARDAEPRPGDARIDRRHPHVDRPQPDDRQFAGQGGSRIIAERRGKKKRI